MLLTDGRRSSTRQSIVGDRDGRRRAGAGGRLGDPDAIKAVAAGKRAAVLRRPHGQRRARARTSRRAARTARADPGRAAAGRGRQRARPGCGSALGLLALAGIALAVFLSPAGDAHRRPPGRRADRDRRARRPHARPLAPHRRRRATTRSRAWLAGSFNTMLEALERVPARAAPARRRRLARAAHAAHLAAHEPRGAGSRRPARRGRPRRACARDLVAQLEELTALVGDLVELARDEEPRRRPSRGACGSTSSWPRRSSARSGTRPACAFEAELEPALVAGVRRAARPRGGEPARQRGQVEPARRRRSRCACATAS